MYRCLTFVEPQIPPNMHVLLYLQFVLLPIIRVLKIQNVNIRGCAEFNWKLNNKTAKMEKFQKFLGNKTLKVV